MKFTNCISALMARVISPIFAQGAPIKACPRNTGPLISQQTPEKQIPENLTHAPRNMPFCLMHRPAPDKDLPHRQSDKALDRSKFRHL